MSKIEKYKLQGGEILPIHTVEVELTGVIKIRVPAFNLEHAQERAVTEWPAWVSPTDVLDHAIPRLWAEQEEK